MTKSIFYQRIFRCWLLNDSLKISGSRYIEHFVPFTFIFLMGNHYEATIFLYDAETQRKKIEGTRHCCSSVSFPARWKTFGENWRIWSLLSVVSCFPLNLSYWKIFAFDSQFSSTPWKTDRRRLMYSGVDDTSYYNIFTFIPRCIFV